MNAHCSFVLNLSSCKIKEADQLSVGLIAQLVEHCTGIAEVVGSNPVHA